MSNAADILNKRMDDILAKAIDEAYLMGAYGAKRLAGMTVSESELYDSAHNVTQSNLSYSNIPVHIIRRNVELLRAAYIAGYNDVIAPQPRSVPSVTIYPVIGLYGDVCNDERIKVTQSGDTKVTHVAIDFQYKFANEWHTHKDSAQYGSFNFGSDEVTYFIVDSIDFLYREHLGYSLPARYFQQNPGTPE
jgi:hypothetical protein